MALSQIHLAADLFARVVQIDPGNATALTNLRMARAAACATRPPEKYLDTALAEARTNLDSGRYGLAAQQIDKLLRLEQLAREQLWRPRQRRLGR